MKDSMLFSWWVINATIIIFLVSDAFMVFVPASSVASVTTTFAIVQAATFAAATTTSSTTDYHPDDRATAATFAVDNRLTTTMDSGDGSDISHLVFHPNILDFNELSIGDADNDVVIVFNNHQNRSVYLGSISGNVPDFYSSFFEEKVIPPLGNTTFNVVFLPRQQGVIQSHLLIHTSFGVINYTVRGKGVECLFRLNPLVGLKAPFNATLTPEIYMYNPFSSPLQIMEVYSSGGQFHLELPSGGPEAPQALWEIPPYGSKPIIRVRFTSTVPGNHTAYIRIKISSANDSELENVVLVVPIEVEITNQYGIYSRIPIINFGLGGNRDVPKKIVFRLFNSGPINVNIQAVSIEGDADVIAAISVIESTADINEQKRITAVADWSKIKAARYFKGNIIVTSIVSNKDYQYKIPFHGELLTGSISYNDSNTKFVAKQATSTKVIHSTTKDFTLRNKYQVSLAITNVTLPGDTAQFFKVSDFVPHILQPDEESFLFRLTQLGAATKRITTRNFLLHTNVSVYEIPVISFSGLLRRIVPVEKHIIGGVGPDEKSINYGTLPLSTLTDTVLAFVNENPLPISIHNWKGTMSGVASIVIILRGCGNLTMDHLKFCYSIQPGEWIVFQISVLSNAVGSFVGNFFVKTDYEEISTPVRFTTAIGRLEFKAIMFDHMECFPSGRCSANITAHSTFHEVIDIDEILINVTGLRYEYPGNVYPEIMPNEETHVAVLQFIPRGVCEGNGNSCQIEFPDRYGPYVINVNSQNFQRDLLTQKLEVYRAMRAAFLSINYQVKIAQHKRYEFNGSADLIWPKLVNVSDSKPIEFQTVQIGNRIVKYINVKNPTMKTLQTYFMLHNVTTNGETVLFPPEVISMCWDCFLTRENVFSLADSTISHKKFVYLPPKSTIKIGLSFYSDKPGDYSTLLYIRNNLTVFEAIWISAKAVVPQFKFGNRKPGSQTPLLFELSDKHLRDCYRKKSDSPSTFTATAKRTFTARNTGDVPIMISNIRVGGEPCEGYGFRVLDCTSFELAPNGSKKLEIAFTPDFTLARVTKILEIETSLNYSVNYTLLSMIPGQALGPCGKAVRRPEWEPIMQRMIFGVLAIAFVLVLSLAVLESDSILKGHLRHMYKSKGPTQPTFNLQKAAFIDESSNNIVQSPATVAVAAKNVQNYNTPILPIANGKRSDNRKRHDTESNKKSFFVPVKSDVKFREATPPPLTMAIVTPVQSKTQHPDTRKDTVSNRRHKETESGECVKRIDDDSSSTTTESSSIDVNEPKSVISPQQRPKKPSAIIVNTLPLSEEKPPIKSKSTVKKAKSLPMPNIISTEQTTATAIKTSAANVVLSPKSSGVVRMPLSVVNSQITSTSMESKVSSSPSTSQSSGSQIVAGQSDRLPNSGGGGQKKHGKTPGRERRKNETIRKQTPKVQSYKGTAFQFTSPITNLAASAATTTHPPIWDTNKISFSNVVAQNSLIGQNQQQLRENFSQCSTLTSTAASTTAATACKCLLLDDDHQSLPKLMSENNANKTNTVYEQLMAHDIASNSVDSNSNDTNGTGIKKTFIDLGPIGSKKSPMSTPIWEPLNHSIEKPLATPNGNSNSYFSGAFPYFSSASPNASIYSNDLNTNKTANVELGGASGLLDNVYGNGIGISSAVANQAHNKPRVWDSALLLSVLQQQQHQDDSDLGNLSAIYSNTNSLWDTATLQNSSVVGPPSTSQAQQIWFQQSAPVRPPPGLELLRNSNMSTCVAAEADKNAQRCGIDDGQNQENILPPFGPFSSLSSIWSSDALLGLNSVADKNGSSKSGNNNNNASNNTNGTQQE